MTNEVAKRVARVCVLMILAGGVIPAQVISEERGNRELNTLINNCLHSGNAYPDALVELVAETAIELDRPEDAVALVSQLRDPDVQLRCVRRISNWLATKQKPQALRVLCAGLQGDELVNVVRAALVQSMVTTAPPSAIEAELSKIADEYARADAALTAAKTARLYRDRVKAAVYVSSASALIKSIASEELQSSERPEGKRAEQLSTQTRRLFAGLAVELYAISRKTEALQVLEELPPIEDRCGVLERFAEIDAASGDWEGALSHKDPASACALIESVTVRTLLNSGELVKAEECARRVGSAALLRKVIRQQARERTGEGVVALVQNDSKRDFAALVLAEAAQRAAEQGQRPEATDLALKAEEYIDRHVASGTNVTVFEDEARCLVANVLDEYGFDEKVEQILRNGAERANNIAGISDPVGWRGVTKILALLRFAETASDCELPRSSSSCFRAAWKECAARYQLQVLCAASVGRSHDPELIHTLIKDVTSEAERGGLLHVTYFEAKGAVEWDESSIPSPIVRIYAELGTLRRKNSAGESMLEHDLYIR